MELSGKCENCGAERKRIIRNPKMILKIAYKHRCSCGRDFLLREPELIKSKLVKEPVSKSPRRRRSR